jgi:hypothetical protein
MRHGDGVHGSDYWSQIRNTWARPERILRRAVDSISLRWLKVPGLLTAAMELSGAEGCSKSIAD